MDGDVDNDDPAFGAGGALSWAEAKRAGGRYGAPELRLKLVPSSELSVSTRLTALALMPRCTPAFRHKYFPSLLDVPVLSYAPALTYDYLHAGTPEEKRACVKLALSWAFAQVRGVPEPGSPVFFVVAELPRLLRAVADIADHVSDPAVLASILCADAPHHVDAQVVRDCLPFLRDSPDEDTRATLRRCNPLHAYLLALCLDERVPRVLRHKIVHTTRLKRALVRCIPRRERIERPDTFYAEHDAAFPHADAARVYAAFQACEQTTFPRPANAAFDVEHFTVVRYGVKPASSA